MRATKNAAGIASALFLCLLAFDPAGAQPASSGPMPAPPASAAPAEDGQWTMPAKNYASTRYSELAEINADNVGKLQVAFTFSTGVNRGQEAAPIVVGGTMYVLSPYPNILYALDLTKDGAPLKWKYEPKPEAAAQGVACCDVVNRGPIFSGGKIFYNTLDGNTVAVDAETGKEAWKTKVGDINIGETMTMAPLVAKGRVLVGNSGGEYGVRGWLKALDAESGKVVWTAYSTGPDKDVLIGSKFKPFYDTDKGQDLGVKTWPPDAWQQGGGTVWGWISYDPDLNLIYYGTGNPGPWNSDQRPGDNKWTAGIFARDLDTGEARWFYQFSPHDLFDWDGINEQILLDMEWNGQPRKVLVRPERNGYLYVIDRQSGEVLSAAALRHDQRDLRRRPQDRPPAIRRSQEAADEQGRARHLPDRLRRQGLEPVGLLAEDRAPLHPARQSLHGRRALDRELHRRHALCRRRGPLQARARRPSRRIPGLGRAAGEVGVVADRELPGLERRARHRRRRRLLRNHGRLVQGGRRPLRQAAVAVQDRLRDHRPADDLSRP